MNGRSATFRSYAELLRVSNLPTVLSNVLTGCALGAGVAQLPWQIVTLCSLAVALLYSGGMALNDATDAESDRMKRPERPIPSGRVSRKAAYRVVLLTLTGGWLLLASRGPDTALAGGVLVAVIVAYDCLHQRHAWMVVFMGLARGMVYLAAAAAVGLPLLDDRGLWFAATLTLYTLAFTLIARSENERQLDERRWISRGLPFVSIVPAVWVESDDLLAAAVTAIPMVVWQWRSARAVFLTPPATKKAVLGWLSGLCLLDVFLLNVLARPGLSLGAVICFLATVVLHRRVSGT